MAEHAPEEGETEVRFFSQAPTQNHFATSGAVLCWCIYTTKLERILAEIPGADERPDAHLRQRSGGNLTKKYPPLLIFTHAHFLFSIKEEENFVLAFCPIGQAEACSNVPLGRR